MKKTRITAFWDWVFNIIIGLILYSVAIYIFAVVKGVKSWNDIPWYMVLLCATCISIPTTLFCCMQKITIDLSKDKVEAFYLVDFVRNERDLRTNWIVYPSEVEKVEVVHLSKEEKRRYTSARFLFSKYLKITHKYGHVKYLYVAHYSNAQIQSIVKLLTSDKTKSKSFEK